MAVDLEVDEPRNESVMLDRANCRADTQYRPPFVDLNYRVGLNMVGQYDLAGGDKRHEATLMTA